MLKRALNMTILLAVLAVPLYGARTRILSSRAARTAEEQLLDLTGLGGATSAKYLISGAGAPYPTFEDCEYNLPGLMHKLAVNGLTLVEAATCVPVEGPVENYTPSFQAVSSRSLEARPVNGGIYSSLSLCEGAALKLRDDQPRDAIVLDLSCGRIQGPAQISADDTVFQAVAVVLRPTTDQPAPAYSAIELLVESTSKTTRRELAGAASPPSQEASPSPAPAPAPDPTEPRSPSEPAAAASQDPPSS